MYLNTGNMFYETEGVYDNIHNGESNGIDFVF
jgi:hypothetical protein